MSEVDVDLGAKRVIHWHKVGKLDEFPIGELVARVVADVRLVVLRTEDKVAVLRDRCPHRFVPLSLGKVVDGNVQCAYHGLQFNTDGRCVFNPHGGGRIPEKAVVESYPVEQQGGDVLVGIG
jgi:vanillate O-demethylase monooxygenase subunit